MEIYKRFFDITEDAQGRLRGIQVINDEEFNFAYDVVDAIAEKDPEKMCMLWTDPERNEKRFTFGQMRDRSIQAANYFLDLGIRKGDHVMLILRRHSQFWIAILALHRIGAVVIPATHQLRKEDLSYRFEKGDIRAVVCTDHMPTCLQADAAVKERIEGGADPIVKIMTGEALPGWHAFDEEVTGYPEEMERVPAGGKDPMLMFFTSGTTGYPKIVTHDFRYPLGHFVTAKYWQGVDPEGIHFTLSDTGWGKALWGKLYGQWLCEAAVFVYDMESLNPNEFLTLFDDYPITTFCAPATAYRIFAKMDLSGCGICRLQRATTAGEALSPEIWKQFYEKTGLPIMEGFGQTETTLTVGTLTGTEPKPGSMGKPSPFYHVQLVDEDGGPVAQGEPGEVVVRVGEEPPRGLFSGYYGGTGNREDVLYNGLYHTGDLAREDEDGYYWYVGRNDDLIKSTGYRVGPAEVESIIMELPQILECGVIGVPDPQRGQRVMAFVVPTEKTRQEVERGELDLRAVKAQVMKHCKKRMANYKCPRKIEILEELPKTISGKIRRPALRQMAGLD